MATFDRAKFMDVEYIHNLLKDNVDPDDVKCWFDDRAYEGEAFSKLSDSLFNVNEDEFLWVVANYISEELDEEEFLETIREQSWDVELPPLMQFISDSNQMSYVEYVDCTIKWNEDGEFEDVIIAVGKDFENMDDEPYDDEDILFYCEDVEDVIRLFNEDNGEDFYIFEYGRCE